MASLKGKMIKSINSCGWTQRQQFTYWCNVKFGNTKHGIKQFPCSLKVSGKIIGMSENYILKHYKESFLPSTESQLIEKDETEAAILNTRVQVLVFGAEPLAGHWFFSTRKHDKYD